MKPDITIHLAESTKDLLTEEFCKERLTKDFYLYPENGKSASQIQQFISDISTRLKPVEIVTDSLYLIREIHLCKVPVTWKNWDTEKKVCQTSTNISDIKNIHVLDKDLDQSGRYMDSELSVEM